MYSYGIAHKADVYNGWLPGGKNKYLGELNHVHTLAESSVSAQEALTDAHLPLFVQRHRNH